LHAQGQPDERRVVHRARLRPRGRRRDYRARHLLAFFAWRGGGAIDRSGRPLAAVPRLERRARIARARPVARLAAQGRQAGGTAAALEALNAAKEEASHMAARAYWQGQIRLALVSIPVEIYAATKSGATIQFHQIHEPSGKRINYEKVVQGVGPVDRDEIVKGYEVSKGNYVLLEDDEIEAAEVESRKTLDLVQFVDAGEIDVFYFEKPYYVVPADDLAEEAFVVLREALKASNKVGIGQISV